GSAFCVTAFCSIAFCLNKMADVNAPSGQAPTMAPPIRTDDQILPRIRWVPNGKSNCYLDLEKSQGNPIYKIAVDLLKNTNFFRAFIASSTIPSIYIQQFWDTIQYDKKSWMLQRRHKFHPRPDSLLHLPNEEPVLRYLKNSRGFILPGIFGKGGPASAVSGMPIPVSLITAEIQEASYYREYLAKEKKRKQATKTSDKPPKAKKSKYGLVSKKCTLKNVVASKAEDVPAMEPQVAAEDTDLQKALEESMKTAYALPRGPLPPVVIRELESGKYQPLPEVPRKGKAKVTEEHVAHDLLSLQKHKKTSHVDQYIFQRRVSEPTESSGHDKSPYALLGQSDSEEESDKTGSDAGAQDEGQAGSNPDETSKGQAGPDPGDAGAKAQSIPSPMVHAGSDREHMDLDVADVSPQPSTEQLDEGFTATAYPKVHQQFKATTTDTTTTTILPPQAQQQSTAEAMMMKHIEQLDIPQQVSKAVSEVVMDAVDWAMQAPLQNRFRDLPKADMKEILHQRMWETESYKSYEDHMQLFEALEKSTNRDHFEELTQDLAEARKRKKNSRESPKTPPGLPSHQPPPTLSPAGPSRASGAP
nr:hypothetical protein [Tanacetum cinerariifolium]